MADNTVAPPAHHDAKLVVYYKPAASSIQDTVGQAQNRRFTAILECLIAGKAAEHYSSLFQLQSGFATKKYFVQRLVRVMSIEKIAHRIKETCRG